jgi:N5-(cytidine 5'-diphosphoramidyl)-L-glutamine hydrolase
VEGGVMIAGASVLVTQRVVVQPDTGEVRDALAQDWSHWLSTRGMRVVACPNADPDPTSFAMDVRARGLILTGGDDLGEWSDAPPALPSSPMLLRDRAEWQLLGWAMRTRTPVLAVCRGMQMINRFFGGAREGAMVGGTIDHARGHHEVRCDERVFAAVGGHGGGQRVNTFHRQCIPREALAPVLRPWMLAEDGVVEGCVHESARVVGVQWHPERDRGHVWSTMLLEHFVQSITDAHVEKGGA